MINLKTELFTFKSTTSEREKNVFKKTFKQMFLNNIYEYFKLLMQSSWCDRILHKSVQVLKKV